MPTEPTTGPAIAERVTPDAPASEPEPKGEGGPGSRLEAADLRKSYSRRTVVNNVSLGVYANERAWKDIRRIFQYVFEPSYTGGGLPQVVPHTVWAGAPFCFGPELRVTPLEVIHGRLPVAAYRFNDFAYATDLSEIPPATIEGLRDLDVLVLDCLRFKPHPTHLWLERALEYISEIRPRRAFLTHLAHDVLHARDSARLPDGVEFAYDGLVISDE
jgi:phosphoribosyl 1,2-cyclic phosphate phosphodiesterase